MKIFMQRWGLIVKFLLFDAYHLNDNQTIFITLNYLIKKFAENNSPQDVSKSDYC